MSNDPIRNKTFPIIIVGSGISSLSTAYHLLSNGAQPEDICVIHDPCITPTSLKTAGLIVASPWDAFTRIHHAHGAEFAEVYWHFLEESFDSVFCFLKTCGVSCREILRIRIASNQHEFRELELSCQLLNAINRQPRNLNKHDLDHAGIWPHHKAIQENNKATFCDYTVLQTHLFNQLKNVVFQKAHIAHLAESSQGITATLNSGAQIQSEIIVLATHFHTRSLLPELRDVFIPYVDQFHQYKIPDANQIINPCIWSYQHGHVWGAINNTIITMGGARYLQPQAGIGQTSAEISNKIEAFLYSLLPKIFKINTPLMLHNRISSIGCYPCDELPVIGPMFGTQRILITTGYMGLGLAMGFYAGHCIANLIMSGTCDILPRLLWPERLRSQS